MSLDIVFALPDNRAKSPAATSTTRSFCSRLAVEQVPEVSKPCAPTCSAGQAGIYCIDTLSLKEFTRFPPPQREQRFVLVVHHLKSFEPDHDIHDPSAILELSTLRCSLPCSQRALSQPRNS